ncbi:erythromycin esterase family protein [Roseateles oligotrophus]|uniref:Erythromycin esterase family protein n=1 Tax=Roseateles oligotrophus TaxID=1769250 RepID=A0ABT2Y9X2_9BURK|nr:erythromycin esterase family protein [Roseateles oligotrophus]MCV2367106.1 erythromycin esterase family protein [Roseateles oligotrophus]
MAALPPAAANAPDDYRDLAPFAEAIGQARIVALGEQTHGGREEFRLKLRLLKFLHEKLGFEVLLLESGFYDIARLAERMAAGEQLDEMAPGHVFFMYANSAEGREMLRYVDAQQTSATPLGLAGIDSQHSGALSQAEMLPRLRAFLRQRGSDLAEAEVWSDFAAPLAQLLAMQPQIPAPALRLAFEWRSQAIRAELCPAAPVKGRPEPAESWCQIVKSLQSQAASVWSGGSDYQRDNQMGDNAIWLMERMFPGKKAVVWAHTIHVAKGFKRSEAQLQAGEVMARHWGAEGYKVVQFTAGGGAVLDFGDMRPRALPALLPGSLEQGLAALAGESLMVQPFERRPITLPQWSIDYQTEPRGQLGRNWDVLFFLRRVGPVTMTR